SSRLRPSASLSLSPSTRTQCGVPSKRILRRSSRGPIRTDMGLFLPGSDVEPHMDLASADCAFIIGHFAALGAARSAAHRPHQHKIVTEETFGLEREIILVQPDDGGMIAAVPKAENAFVHLAGLRRADIVCGVALVIADLIQRPEGVAHAAGSQQHHAAIGFLNRVTEDGTE